MLTSMTQLSPRDLRVVLHRLVTELRGKDNRVCPIPLNRISPSIPVEYTAKPQKHQKPNSTKLKTLRSQIPCRLPCYSGKLLPPNPKRPFRTQPSKNSWPESQPTTLHRQCALSNPKQNSRIAKCTNVETPKDENSQTPTTQNPSKNMSRASKFEPALGGRGLEIRDPTAAIARARGNPQPSSANASHDGIRRGKGQVRAQKDLAALDSRTKTT